MRNETRQVLELIVEKANKLRAFGFEKHVREVGLGFKAERRTEGDWLWDFGVPDEKERDAFLLTFRLLYQRNEAIALLNLHALAQDQDLSENWRQEADRTRQAFQDYLDGCSTYSVNLFEGYPTRRDMLETALYGGIAHANKPHLVRQFRRWMSDGIRASVFEQEFARFLVAILGLIYHIAEVSAAELCHNAA